jgi:hypothetical protein
MTTTIADDVAAIGRLDVIPKILEVACRSTGMGFAAVARVTEDRWVACAVRDEIAFGLGVAANWCLEPRCATRFAATASRSCSAT